MRQITIHKNKSGSSLPMVIAMSAILMTSALFIFNRIITSAKFSILSVKKSNSTYAAEGLITVMVNLTQSYLQQSTVLSSAAITSYISSRIATAIPKGYTLKSWKVTIDPNSMVQLVPSGPFADMQSDAHKVRYTVTLVSDVGGFETIASLEGQIAGITFTQFGIFSFADIGLGTIVNRMIIKGRIHANGSVQMGSSKGTLSLGNLGTEFLSAKNLTVGGYTFSSPDIGSNVLRQFYASDNSTTNYKELKAGATSGCSNCDGTGLDWPDYALANWNGHLLDAFHNIPILSVKTATPPEVQKNPTYSIKNLPERFLIDPVRPTDEVTVKQGKFAYKADIRIINGVWYLKNPADETQWPGIPIWSDHPGKYETPDEEGIIGVTKVGQEDIREWLNSTAEASGNAWPTGTVPKKFSYYEYDNVNKRLEWNTEGIISYGNITKKTPIDLFEPGHYVTNNLPSGNSSFCVKPTGNGACINCETDFLNKLYTISDNITCGGGNEPDTASKILNATRGGFRFGIWMYYTAGTTEEKTARSKIYPINFDLNTFQNALSCNVGTDHPGELGCYFSNTGLMKRPFNGIIYISATWNGSLNGFTSGGLPTRPPFMHEHIDNLFTGTNKDSGQIPVLHPTQQESLPFELCSSSLATQPFDSDNLFTVPACSRYTNVDAVNTIRTRPNALRIINGANINPARLPKGLTIASNLHSYIAGDLNTSSDVSTQISTPWLPVLIAADDTMLLSNAWSDQNSRWDVAPDTLTRDAADTTFNAAFMKYWPFHLLTETWTGKNLYINGPTILSHYTIYPEIVMNYSIGAHTWKSPLLESYNYDPHFELIKNQPPGTPYMTIFATSGWIAK